MVFIRSVRSVLFLSNILWKLDYFAFLSLIMYLYASHTWNLIPSFFFFVVVLFSSLWFICPLWLTRKKNLNSFLLFLSIDELNVFIIYDATPMSCEHSIIKLWVDFSIRKNYYWDPVNKLSRWTNTNINKFIVCTRAGPDRIDRLLAKDHCSNWTDFYLFKLN